MEFFIPLVSFILFWFGAYKYYIIWKRAKMAGIFYDRYVPFLLKYKHHEQNFQSMLQHIVGLNWRNEPIVKETTRKILLTMLGCFILLATVNGIFFGFVAVVTMPVFLLGVIIYAYIIIRRDLKAYGDEIKYKFIGLGLHLHPRLIRDWLKETISAKLTNYTQSQEEEDDLNQDDFYQKQFGYLIHGVQVYAPYVKEELFKELPSVKRVALKRWFQKVNSSLPPLMLNTLLHSASRTDLVSAMEHVHALEPEERVAPIRAALASKDPKYRSLAVEALYYYHFPAGWQSGDSNNESSENAILSAYHEAENYLFERHLPASFHPAVLMLFAPPSELENVPLESLDFEMLVQLLELVRLRNDVIISWCRYHKKPFLHRWKEMLIDLITLQDIQITKTLNEQGETLHCQKCCGTPKKTALLENHPEVLICPYCGNSTFTGKYTRVVGVIGDLPSDDTGSVLYLNLWHEADRKSLFYITDEIHILPSSEPISYDWAVNAVLETYQNVGHTRYHIIKSDSVTLNENTLRRMADYK